MKIIIKFFYSTLLSIIASLFTAFVLTKLWLWFIVPFFEVRPLIFIEALGLWMFTHFINYKFSDYKLSLTNDPGFEDIIERAVTLLCHSTASFLIGWMISLFL